MVIHKLLHVKWGHYVPETVAGEDEKALISLHVVSGDFGLSCHHKLQAKISKGPGDGQNPIDTAEAVVLGDKSSLLLNAMFFRLIFRLVAGDKFEHISRVVDQAGLRVSCPADEELGPNNQADDGSGPHVGGDGLSFGILCVIEVGLQEGLMDTIFDVLIVAELIYPHQVVVEVGGNVVGSAAAPVPIKHPKVGDSCGGILRGGEETRKLRARTPELNLKGETRKELTMPKSSFRKGRLIWRSSMVILGP